MAKVGKEFPLTDMENDICVTVFEAHESAGFDGSELHSTKNTVGI